MNERERLLELMKESVKNCDPGTSCLHCRYRTQTDCMERITADYMIVNGVTAQRWIPVTERLPEKNTSVLVSTDNGIVFQCLYAYDGWDLWDGNEVNITHWQPMPQPPKGE